MVSGDYVTYTTGIEAIAPRLFARDTTASYLVEKSVIQDKECKVAKANELEWI